MFGFIEYFHSLDEEDKEYFLIKLSSKTIYDYLLSDITESRKKNIINLLKKKLPEKYMEIKDINNKNNISSRKNMIKNALEKNNNNN